MKQFKDEGFRFGLQLVLGAVYDQAADAGEALATAERIDDGDADSWVNEWLSTAGACWAAAREADQAGRKVSALAHYRRAATYYASALSQITHTAHSSPGRELDVWRRQRDCWERVVDLQPTPGRRMTIPYEDTSLPGYFFPAPGLAPDERRPVVVLNNGSDAVTSQMWVEGGAAAARRGWHWMTFDGPGQQAALYEQGLFFRPDWEAVLTPVLDAVLTRADVDAERVVVVGVSQGGYWVTRALAFEHRCRAAVVDPGVTDVSASWIGALPQAMRSQLRDGEQTTFDRELHLAELLSPATASTLAYRGRPYGVKGTSRFDLYQTVSRYRLDGEEKAITTPMLITDPENEQLWPGQSRELHQRLSGISRLVPLPAHEGADGHGEPMARSLRETRIYDWLEDQLT